MIGNITIQGIRIPLTASMDGMLEKLTWLGEIMWVIIIISLAIQILSLKCFDKCVK